MGFPSEKMDSSRKTSAPPSSSEVNSESIPIRVIHEKHKYTPGQSRTTDLPSTTAGASGTGNQGSPRVTRAHSEPPKTFNQRLLKTKIPLGNVSEQNEHNLSTSASDSSVPHSESPKTRETITGQNSFQAPPQPQQAAPPSAAPEPTVRHIPIRVEGREEPVNNVNVNKKPSDFYPSNAKVERRAQQPPNSLKVNSSKNVQNNMEPTSPLSPIPSDQPIPMGYEVQNSNLNNGSSAATSGPALPTSGAEKKVEPAAPAEPVSAPIPMPCSPDYLQDKPSQKEPETATSSTGNKREDDPCMIKLDKIMDNVRDLEKKISAFQGDKDSKEYRFLDEMLTRNLLALDGIDTAGRADIRQQRKESIKSINRCLSLLESKAKNQAEKNNAILSELAQQSM